MASDSALKQKLITLVRKLADTGRGPFEAKFPARPFFLRNSAVRKALFEAYGGQDVVLLLKRAGLEKLYLRDLSKVIGERRAKQVAKTLTGSRRPASPAQPLKLALALLAMVAVGGFVAQFAFVWSDISAAQKEISAVDPTGYATLPMVREAQPNRNLITRAKFDAIQVGAPLHAAIEVVGSSPTQSRPDGDIEGADEIQLFEWINVDGSGAAVAVHDGAITAKNAFSLDSKAAPGLDLALQRMAEVMK